MEQHQTYNKLGEKTGTLICKICEFREEFVHLEGGRLLQLVDVLPPGPGNSVTVYIEVPEKVAVKI